MARMLRKRRNALTSIHDPPDPSPRSLPAEAKAEWGEAYRDALDLYQKDDLAQRAAWREVKLRWQQRGKDTWQRCKNGICYWPQATTMPRPAMALAPLGVLIEYVFLDRRGRLHVNSFNRNHPPILWWDDKQKLLYAFPRQEYPMECLPITPDLAEAAEVYERWHQRPAKCGVNLKIPKAAKTKIHAIGAADSLSYASDKWNEDNPDPALKRAQEYIHNHWYDVWIWQDTDRETPNVILIEGGELDLHERGLIH